MRDKPFPRFGFIYGGSPFCYYFAMLEAKEHKYGPVDVTRWLYVCSMSLN